MRAKYILPGFLLIAALVQGGEPEYLASFMGGLRNEDVSAFEEGIADGGAEAGRP